MRAGIVMMKSQLVPTMFQIDREVSAPYSYHNKEAGADLVTRSLSILKSLSFIARTRIIRLTLLPTPTPPRVLLEEASRAGTEAEFNKKEKGSDTTSQNQPRPPFCWQQQRHWYLLSPHGPLWDHGRLKNTLLLAWSIIIDLGSPYHGDDTLLTKYCIALHYTHMRLKWPDCASILMYYIRYISYYIP